MFNEYHAQIKFDQKYYYINTIYLNNRWIPVIGRCVKLDNESFFVYTISTHKKNMGYIMKLYGRMPIASFEFQNYDELTNIVLQFLSKYYIEQVVAGQGSDAFDDSINYEDRPPILRKTSAEMDSPKGQNAMSKIINFQQKYANFKQNY